MANIRSGCSDCDATISSCPTPIGLAAISVVTEMTTLIEPVTHRSDLYGWAGWIHWETSGAHFYAWEQPTLFFSVDIYTCKAFDPRRVAAFTKEFFGASDLVYRGF